MFAQQLVDFQDVSSRFGCSRDSIVFANRIENRPV